VAELAHRPLSLNLIRRAHEVLLDGARGGNRRPGAFRDRQVHIGPPGSTPSTATYLPPSATDLPELLHNLETYFHYEREDLLIQVSIIHAQFELIHPFFDGNGRIGRMLVPLFLYAKKAIATPSFFISAFLEENREEYFRALQRLSTDDDWQGWVRFFLSAIECQAERDSQRAGEILRLYDEMKRIIADTLRSRHAIRVLDALFAEPIFSTPGFQQAAGLPRNAGALLRKLETRGHLRVLRAGARRRATIWMFPGLLQIIQAPDPASPSAARSGDPRAPRTLASASEA
jgi:Fic family protein